MGTVGGLKLFLLYSIPGVPLDASRKRMAKLSPTN